MTKAMMVIFGLATLGAGYMTWYGVGAESRDVARSVRLYSVGNGGIGSIK